MLRKNTFFFLPLSVTGVLIIQNNPSLTTAPEIDEVGRQSFSLLKYHPKCFLKLTKQQQLSSLWLKQCQYNTTMEATME